MMTRPSTLGRDRHGNVYHDSATYWLADGFHRYFASIKAGREAIGCEIIKGTKRDAVLHAVGANADHGLRRTNADKRKAVLTLLNDPEWVQWPQRKIAEVCRVSPEYVSRLKNGREHLLIDQ